MILKREQAVLCAVCCALLLSLHGLGAARAADTLGSFLPLGELQPASGGPQQQAEALQALAQGLRETDAFRSEGDLRFVIVRSSGASWPHSSVLGYPGPSEFKTRWAFKGGKLRYESERVWLPGENAKWMGHVVAVFDGTASTVYYPSGKRATISSGTAARLRAIEEEWLIVPPGLADRLAKPGATYDGHQSVGGEDCRRVTVPLDNGTGQLWITDDNHVLRREDVRTNPTGGIRCVSEVESFTGSTHGSRFPSKGKTSDFIRSDNDEQWQLTIEWRLANRSTSVPDSVFTVDMAPGTAVSSSTSGETVTFTVGE